MGPGRPRTAIGTFGDFTYVTALNGKVKARVRFRFRFRDDDGQLRLVQATGDSRKSAEQSLNNLPADQRAKAVEQIMQVLAQTAGA